MILDELKIIDIPDDMWLTRLRRGHFVWAIKEKRFAKIEWAWGPPDPGCISGIVGIRLCWRENDNWGLEYCHSWFVKSDGTGLDGKPLLLPLENNCPDEPKPISEPWQRQIERQMSYMLHRIEQLESQVANNSFNFL